ncbi:GxxExxY protein [Bacteroidota bacterium]
MVHAFELFNSGFEVKQQVPMPFIHKSVKQDVGYRIDLMLNNKVIVEVKSIEALAPIHFAQTLVYLILSNLKPALMINFNSKTFKDNIHRIVNNL